MRNLRTLARRSMPLWTSSSLGEGAGSMSRKRGVSEQEGGKVGEVGKEVEEEVVIAIGGNIGDRVANFNRGLKLLKKAGVNVVSHGSLYESAPAYVTDQPFFLNSAVKARTTLPPHDLLRALKEIEAELGRDFAEIRNGPRPLDLDIIFYGTQSVHSDTLQIPHPRIFERPFVLAPVVDLLPSRAAKGGNFDMKSGKGTNTSNKSLTGDVGGGVGNDKPEECHWSNHAVTHGRGISSMWQELGGEGVVGSWGLKGVSSIRTGRKGERSLEEEEEEEEETDGKTGLVQSEQEEASVGGGERWRGEERREGELWEWGKRTRVMGVLNVTPDSFSDGGAHFQVEDAVRRAKEMVKEGADIIDIGGQSTRPGAEPVPASEELARVLPVLRHLSRDPDLAGVAISVDTFSSQVARAAVEEGASLINDISGGLLDPGIRKIAAEYDVPYVIMHMRGTPATMSSKQNTTYDDLIADVATELAARVAEAEAEGVPAWRILLDPGIGFAKKGEQNLELIRKLPRLREELGRVRKGLEFLPLILGVSRKRFLGEITGKQRAEERDWGTGAAIAGCILGGADVVRVHNVKHLRDVVRVSDALWREAR